MSVLADYEQHLSRLPLSKHTKRNYLARVRKYLAWIESSGEAPRALSEGVERDLAVREYKQHLMISGSTSSTVNSHLSAIDNLYLFLGLGPAGAKRQELPALAPRALDQEELRRLLKAVAQTKSYRNKSIALLMLHCGLRISEVHSLLVSDVLLCARKREVTVRLGKGDKRRTVPINADTAEALRDYLQTSKRADPNLPLFGSRKTQCISESAIDHLIRQFGREAGIELSSHRLRHTCLTRLVRGGVDIVAVASIAGHSRLETTRRYTLPSSEVMVSAMEQLNSPR